MQELFLNREEVLSALHTFGSPLYVYSEEILRRQCRAIRSVFSMKNAFVSYSVKANTNLSLLKIVREEGLHADVMSPGELAIAQKAGFMPEELFYVCNNVSGAELAAAADAGLVISVDSVSQLETLGEYAPGAKCAVRINTQYGDGLNEKVITAGKHTKFGVEMSLIPEVKEIAARYGLHVVGLNQHIGSFIRDPENFRRASELLIDTAKAFPELTILDFGGGLPVPYQKTDEPLDLSLTRSIFDDLYARAVRELPAGDDVVFQIEPGRSIVAECGQLLGTVEAVKENYGTTYVGTDIGFNVLLRPLLYEAYHEIVFPLSAGEKRPLTVTGNICESGDILAKDRVLPLPKVGEPVAILTAGAYGFAMSSPYNCRLRPAEVLYQQDGTFRLIRRRETVEDLLDVFPE